MLNHHLLRDGNAAGETLAAPREAPVATEEMRHLEEVRLEAVRAYEILDTAPEAAFDRVTALAARLFGVPIAMISLVDEERLWFKSVVGLDVCEIPRGTTFCSYAIERSDVTVVTDTHLDAIFVDNRLVLGAPFVRFYAGAPLINRDGMALGTLCLLDSKPRDFNDNERQTLMDLAATVVDALELRRAARQIQRVDAERLAVQTALFDSQNRFQSAFEMSANGMALISLQGQFLQVNERLCALLDYSREQLLARTFQEITNPDDLPRNMQKINALIAGETKNFTLEKRYLRADGSLFWASSSVSLVRDKRGEPDHFVAQVEDISVRKHVEQELRYSEARKAAILETALDCIVTIDARETVIEWNPASEKTFGFSRAEAMGKPLHELIVPTELSAAHSAGMKHFLETGEGPVLGKRLELPAMRKDGARITVELAIVPIPGTSPPLFTGHLRDISERRSAEERLRLLESVAVNANDAILITEAEPVDLPGPRIIYANKSFLEMSGYTMEEILGQTPRILQGEGTLDESRAKIRRALKGWKPIVIEMLNYKKCGTPFWVELSITPIANEKGWYTHWVSIQRDISERREILDALRESESRYGRIAANVPGMVYQFSLNPTGAFGFPYVSEGSRDIFGLEPADLMSNPSKVLDHVHFEDEASFLESVDTSAQTLMAWEWEGRINVAGHGLKWIRGTSRPKREASGEVVWDGILIDITGRKAQEELLQEAKDEAETARREAERANLAKSEFLGRMSHELRTPLNAILGFGQLLEMAPLNEEDGESTGQILKAGRHLLQLINEVLDIARIESGQLSLSPEAVCAREVLLETLDLVRPLATRRGITLRDEAIRGGDTFVWADRQRLKQVLLNLLSNAIKYNRENGEVTLTCELVAAATSADSSGTAPVPRLKGWNREAQSGLGRIRIGVRDEGAGIAEALRPRLFTAFDRLGAENSSVEGTGVGLALSLRLAQAMQGTLDFESQVGQGSLFWIELPRAADPLQKLELPPALETEGAVVSTRMVVLYVEDNPSNLQLVQRLLAHRPEIRLLTAMQGGMGVELARQHCPDLILLDMNLPDIPGSEVLSLLRAETETRGIPVVVVSADATEKQIARMMSAGAAQYLTKPFDVREFLAILDDNIPASAPAN